ncbi:hypothetical protein Hamer_G002525 [Homarus americanus]|uniref:Uncharacterized protein n=1 Tax=Homarus americanus TaxID=6706 RepID=A0A8J5K650_HOMAM|nr:hypothetical protein Hamer_G002525 [Homarus americanus]
MDLDDWLVSTSSKEEEESSTRGQRHGLQNQPSEVLPFTITTTGVAGDEVGHLHGFPPPLLRLRTTNTTAPLCCLKVVQLYLPPVGDPPRLPQLCGRGGTPGSSAFQPLDQGGKRGHPGRTQESRTSLALHLSSLLHPWLSHNALLWWTLWVPPTPTLSVAPDASDGLDRQMEGISHQCTRAVRGVEILEYNQLTENETICLEMDSTAAVFCLNRQGTSCWTDALSHFKGTSVEWTLRQNVFQSLIERWGRLEVDHFASQTSAQLSAYLSRLTPTPHRGPVSPRSCYRSAKSFTASREIPPPGPLLAGSTMVLRATRLVSASTDVRERLPLRSLSCQVTEITSLTCVEFLHASLSRLYSRRMVEEILSGLRPSTNRQYKSCWKAFQQYPREQAAPTPSESIVLKFLSSIAHEQGRSIPTLYVHLAALTDPLDYGCRVKVNNRSVTLLRWGLFHQQPPARPPRSFWSLEKSSLIWARGGHGLQVLPAIGTHEVRPLDLLRPRRFCNVPPTSLVKNERENHRLQPVAVLAWKAGPSANTFPLRPITPPTSIISSFTLDLAAC